MKSEAKTPAVRARQDAALLAAALNDLRMAQKQVEFTLRTTATLAIETILAHPTALPIDKALLVQVRLELSNDGRPSLGTLRMISDAVRQMPRPETDKAARDAAERLRDSWKEKRIDDLVERELV